MKSIRGVAGQVRIGAPDASLTPVSGVVAVTELAGRLGVVAALDDAVGAIKQRDRGLSAGGLLLALAQTQMLGGDFLVSLDRRRDDLVGEALSAVPTPGLDHSGGTGGPLQSGAVGRDRRRYRRAHPPGGRIAAGQAAGPAADRPGHHRPGRHRRRGVWGQERRHRYTYKGSRAGRPHVATWAEAGLVVAADLLAGDEDPRPGAGDLIDSAVATLDIAGVVARPRVRGDVGYFAADIAWAAVDAGCDFSLGVTRNKAAWRAAAAIPDQAWTKAKRMRGAQVAVMDYAPAGWPPGTTCVVRRVRVRAADVSTDPRARRRRTIPKDQLALALDGLVAHVYAYSFIATNADVSTPAKTAAHEAWHRMRTDIEDRIRDAKHGATLRHLPSANQTVNTIWMWAAMLAINLSTWLQELTGLDHGDGRGRAHLGTLRHRLLNVPARLVRHAGQVTLRLPPGHHLLAHVVTRLRQLHAWT